MHVVPTAKLQLIKPTKNKNATKTHTEITITTITEITILQEKVLYS